MISRCFILLIIFALLCAIGVITAEKEKTEDGKGETGEEEGESDGDPYVDSSALVARLLESMFTGAARNCLEEAVNRCKNEYKNPGTTLRCGRKFSKQNSERCTTTG